MHDLKIIKHNAVTQMITIGDAGPFTTTAPISSKRKHPSTILWEMQGSGPHGDAKLQHIGLSLPEVREKMRPQTFGNRARCDTCLFRGGQHRCVWDKEKNVCKTCLMVFGRPFCSWTPGIPSPFLSGTKAPGNDFHHLEKTGNTADIFRRTALLTLKGWPGTDTMTVDPISMEVDTGEDDDQDPQELTGTEADAEADAEAKAEAEAEAEIAEAAEAAEAEGDWMGPE